MRCAKNTSKINLMQIWLVVKVFRNELKLNNLIYPFLIYNIYII